MEMPCRVITATVTQMSCLFFVCLTGALPTSDDVRVVRLLVGLVAADCTRFAHLSYRPHLMHRHLLSRTHVSLVVDFLFCSILSLSLIHI